MPIIRKYKQEDKEQLRSICIATTLMTVNDKTRQVLPLLWNDYYTEHEPDNIFVLDDNGKAVGYLLCSTSHDYYEVMKREYLPKVKRIDGAMAFGYKLNHLFESKYDKRYGAHLHIDILPEYQRGGWGGKMMDCLMLHINDLCVGSVYLGCAANNAKGAGFYAKYGFKAVSRAFGTIVFAIDVKEKACNLAKK